MDALLPRRRRQPRLQQAARRRRVQGAGSQDRALEHPRHRQAHRRPRPEDRAPDRRRSRRAAAHARLGAVHPRRDPGAGGGHARHRRGRAVHRRAAGHATKRPSCCTTTSRPISVGETGRMGAPGRREIGHGKLAWRAIHPMLPAPAEFPYTIRVVSEITESNGSSSMATVCGSSLALMDAGVPLKRPTAGIAMGLILEDKRLRGALRHPRRRGSSRRHGLQGGRHRARRHLAADGHQDRRHHRGDHEGRARAGEGRPPAHPRRDGQGARPPRAPSSASTRRASRCSRSRPTRSAK